MNKKVLIIDDDEEMCAELKEILTDEGYYVYMALDGNRGKELMEKEEFQVVILDLKLPGLNGYEVLQIVKSKAQGPRVIVLSGRPLGEHNLFVRNNAEKEEERVLQLADAILNKPVHLPVLIEKIQEYIKN